MPNGNNTYAYACPPFGERDPSPDIDPPVWPTTDRVVIPSTPIVVTLESVAPIPGLLKLRERLKQALRDEEGAMLDMDEVAAMVWLEGLR